MPTTLKRWLTIINNQLHLTIDYKTMTVIRHRVGDQKINFLSNSKEIMRRLWGDYEYAWQGKSKIAMHKTPSGRGKVAWSMLDVLRGKLRRGGEWIPPVHKVTWDSRNFSTLAPYPPLWYSVATIFILQCTVCRLLWTTIYYVLCSMVKETFCQECLRWGAGGQLSLLSSFRRAREGK